MEALAAGRPPMSRAEVDLALTRLLDEQRRIAAALVDLEGQPGLRLIKGTELTGSTLRRWQEADARLTALWRTFDAYRGTLGRAEEIRGRRSKPGQEELAALTELLAGPSVEPAADEIPLQQRRLLGPTTRRLSLDQAVDRMSADYEHVVEVVAAIDAAWSVLLPRMEAVENGVRTARELAASLGVRHAALERLEAAFAALSRTVRTDPLAPAFTAPPAPATPGGAVVPGTGTAPLDDIDTRLAAVRAELDEIDAVRREYGRRVERVEASIARVESAVLDAFEARDVAVAKIASPVFPDIPVHAASGLRARLDRLAELRRKGDWPALATEAGALERSAAAAADAAVEAVELIRGLVDRRNELRGRLDTFRVQAARLGHVEDPELVRLYEHARGLLWTAPCDLRESTVAVAAYVRAITTLRDRGR